MWQCNVSLISSAVGSFYGRDDMIAAGVCSVALDQTLYWIDVLSFIFTRKYIIGVAKYLS